MFIEATRQPFINFPHGFILSYEGGLTKRQDYITYWLEKFAFKIPLINNTSKDSLEITHEKMPNEYMGLLEIFIMIARIVNRNRFYSDESDIEIAENLKQYLKNGY